MRSRVPAFLLLLPLFAAPLLFAPRQRSTGDAGTAESRSGGKRTDALVVREGRREAAVRSGAGAPGTGVEAGAARPAAGLHRTFSFNGREFPADARAATRLEDARRGLRAGETLPVLVGLRDVPGAAQRGELRERGVDLLAYLPDNGWVARLHAGPSDEYWSRGQVRGFERLDETMRLAPDALAPCDCERIPLFVHVLPDRDPPACAARWAGPGVDVSAHHAGAFPYVAARVERSVLPRFVERVARDPDVLLVERGGGARLLNDNSMRILQSGSYTGNTPIFARGIHGSNQVIAVCDTGLDADSCYFRDTNGALPPANRVHQTNVNWALRKVIAADFLYAGDDPASSTAWDNQGHGTHVAGDACGSSLTDPTGTFSQNGMAPGAKLIVQDGGYTVDDDCADLVGLGCPITNFYPALQQAFAQGARIHNNSWGDNENNVFGSYNLYSQASRDLDQAAWDQRDFLVVCAAGNRGPSMDTVNSPSTAKNGLSVAATVGGSGADSIASFSSRGWTSDRRVKPDLAAPGASITASSSDGSLATSNCTTQAGSGTSFASPLVCGLAALVRDYFAQGYYPSRRPVASNAFPFVSAALVKAMLVNACRPMSGAGHAPSREQGWGRPNLSLVLAFTNSPHRLLVADAGPTFRGTPAQPFTAWLNVRSTNAPLKVVLAWTDYPGTPGAGKQLVNDLDLVVRTPGGSFHGNIISNSSSFAGTAFDRTNNIEQVYLPTPATGLVEVSVWANVIPQATQDFAIVASGDIEEVPKSRDDDGDGLPDYFELLHYGSLATAVATNDFDGDGANDLAECIAGTEPTNAVSRFAIQGLTLGPDLELQVAFPSIAGRAYTLLSGDGPSQLLPASQWVAGVPETNGPVDLVETNSFPVRFFGVRVTAP